MDNIAESVKNFTIELNKKLSEAESLEKKLAYFTETATIGIYDNNCTTRLDDVLDDNLISGWMDTMTELIEKLQKAKNDEILIMMGKKQPEPIIEEPKTAQIEEKETETIKSSTEDKKTLKNENTKPKRSTGLSDDMIKKIQDMYKDGKSKNGIAKITGIAYNTVDKYLTGIERPKSDKGSETSKEEKPMESAEPKNAKSAYAESGSDKLYAEDVLKYYTKTNRTLKECAEHFGVDKKTMYQFIQKNGLERPSYSGR